MSDVTRILNQIQDGDPAAADQLLPLLYDELRKLAAAKLRREQRDESLDATALVHEAYLRLVGDASFEWESRGHFFGAAAEAMRRILINRARDRGRLKRGGGRRRIDLSKISVAVDTPSDSLIELDEAIVALAERDPVSADLVKLRFFAGLPLKHAAESLGLSRRQGDRHYTCGRARSDFRRPVNRFPFGVFSCPAFLKKFTTSLAPCVGWRSSISLHSTWLLNDYGSPVMSFLVLQSATDKKVSTPPG